MGKPPSFIGKENNAADAIVWQAEGPSVLPQGLRDGKLPTFFWLSIAGPPILTLTTKAPTNGEETLIS
jgi:hypothetical protein